MKKPRKLCCAKTHKDDKGFARQNIKGKRLRSRNRRMEWKMLSSIPVIYTAIFHGHVTHISVDQPALALVNIAVMCSVESADKISVKRMLTTNCYVARLSLNKINTVIS